MPPTIISLAASGVPATTAAAELQLLTPAARLGRAGLTLAAAVVLAVLMVPIPIVHLVGIPLVLLIGSGLAVRQFLGVARLAPVTMPCPRCAAPNRVGGGFGYRTATGPVELQCEACRRPLELRWGGEGET